MDAALTARLARPLPRRSMRRLVVLLRVGGNDSKKNGLLPERWLATAILPIVSSGAWTAQRSDDDRRGNLRKVGCEGHGQILPPKNKSAMRKIILAIRPQCGQSNSMTATLTLPTIPSHSLAKFSTPVWNQFAGESGAYQAESLCGQFAAIAEPVDGGYDFFLVSYLDGSTLAFASTCVS